MNQQTLMKECDGTKAIECVAQEPACAIANSLDAGMIAPACSRTEPQKKYTSHPLGWNGNPSVG